ncbi:MAG TPA: patatin-like phospholipase family protein [Kiritimatiellia bacterium]|nr:patatin-like phospholipase family protein [Kiritimatiellia bacterium]
MSRFGKHKRVGLALGSGGARGWAHLGVLQALREKGIAVECVAGTSMGAVIGAFFAARREDVLRELARDLDWKRLRPFFWEVSLSRSGLTDGRKLLEEFRKMLGLREFRELDLPFRAVATDLDTGGEVVLSSGNLLQAVRASISIPGLFSPVQVGRRLLVDGGLVNPVPVSVAREMGAQVVIGVDVSQGIVPEPQPSVRKNKKAESARGPLALPKPASAEEKAGAMGLLDAFRAEIEKKVNRLRAVAADAAARPAVTDVLVRSVRIAEARIALARRQTEPPDVLIEPAVGGIGTLEFHRAQDALAAGYAAALQALA